MAIDVRQIEQLGYNPSALATMIGKGMNLLDFFRGLGLIQNNRRDFIIQDNLNKAQALMRTMCFQLVPVAQVNGHNYAMGIPLEITPATVLGSSGYTNLPRRAEGRNSGNTIIFQEIEIRMPGFILTKDMIRTQLREAKARILENFLEIEKNTERLNYLDVTSKTECIEEEFKAFNVLKTLDTTKPIKEQIDHLMAMLK